MMQHLYPGPCDACSLAHVMLSLARAMRRRYDMGMGVFSNPDGCGRGEGIVHLRITYTPFTAFQRHPADSITVRTSNADPKSQL